MYYVFLCWECIDAYVSCMYVVCMCANCVDNVWCVCCVCLYCVVFALESTNQGHFNACVHVGHVQPYVDGAAQNLEIISKALLVYQNDAHGIHDCTMS